MSPLAPRLALLSLSVCGVAAWLSAAPAAAAVPLRPTTPVAPLTQTIDAARPAAPLTFGDTELLDVRINDVAQPDGVRALRLPSGRLAVPAEALAAWLLRNPAVTPLRFDGRDHYPLDAVTGLSWRIDPASQTLVIQAPAEAFARNRFEVVNQLATTPTPSSPGGYVNYDLNWQRDGAPRGGRATQQASGLIELGAFNASGNGRTSAYWRNGSLPQGLSGERGNSVVRLDSTWNVDMPERLTSLRFGDSIGSAGAWGRSVRFGGLQWASNFSMQPGFVRFPLPAVRGEATLPSVVDLYINNVHQLQGQLPPGPFDLPNVPVVTGPGSIRMVVRDLLGREQVIVQPYYVSPVLLRPGLHEFSVDAGWLRQDYGLASNRYGSALLTGTSRLGISPTFTREWRAELQRRQQTLGAGGSWLLGDFGSLNGIAAASHGPQGYGGSFGAAIDRQAMDWSLSLQARWSSRQFVQLGQGSLLSPATRLQVTAGVGTSLGSGSLSLNLLHQAGWGAEQPITALSLNYGRSLGSLGYLGLYATRNTGQVDGYVVGINFIHQWDAQTSVGASVNSSGASVSGQAAGAAASPRMTQTTLQAQRNPPPGSGIGYQVLTEAGTNARSSGEATWQTDQAAVNVGVARANGAPAYRAGVSGGVAVMPEGVFASRRIDGSFAVVKVGDFEGVRVTRDNQVVARTDAKGRALVTGLRSHEANRIGVEVADLPLDAEVDQLQMAVSPGARSGVSAVFAVRRTRAATLRLVMADGSAVPPGSSVQIEGANRQYPVGYRGLVFVVGLAERTRIVAVWPDHRCSADLVLSHAENDLPDLGTVMCRKEPA